MVNYTLELPDRDPNAVRFNYGNSANGIRVSRFAGLSGVSPSDKGIISFWIKQRASAGGRTNFQQDIYFARTSANLGGELPPGLGDIGNPIISLENTSGGHIFFQGPQGVILNSEGSAKSPVTSGSLPGKINPSAWAHVLITWNGSLSANALFINHELVCTDSTIGTSGITGNYDQVNYQYIGWPGVSGDPLGGMDGCLSEFYFAPGEYLDPTVTANRFLFATSSLRAPQLGQQGQVPTGNRPAIYLPGSASTFINNKGYAGDFVVSGSLLNCATSPAGIGPAPINFQWEGTTPNFVQQHNVDIATAEFQWEGTAPTLPPSTIGSGASFDFSWEASPPSMLQFDPSRQFDIVWEGTAPKLTQHYTIAPPNSEFEWETSPPSIRHFLLNKAPVTRTFEVPHDCREFKVDKDCRTYRVIPNTTD